MTIDLELTNTQRGSLIYASAQQFVFLSSDPKESVDKMNLRNRKKKNGI